MAKRKKSAAKRPVIRRPWTERDLKRLRKLATRQPARSIAAALGRTHAALIFKAHVEGISLRYKRRQGSLLRKRKT